MTWGSMMTIARSVLGSVGLGLLLAFVWGANPASAQMAKDFHPGCDRLEKSRHPDCVSAIHRFCSADNRGGAGLAQEVAARPPPENDGLFGVACFTPSSYDDVPLAQLTQRHPGCGLETSQGGDCMAAVHRWCVENRKGGAGLAQEVGNGVFGVACFQPSGYQDVAVQNLKALIAECDGAGKSQHQACVAAIHRWCVGNQKGDAGIAQEVGNGVFGVACFRTTSYTDLVVYKIPNPR
jgi:hypothetical protein